MLYWSGTKQAHLSNAYQNDKHFFGTAEFYEVVTQDYTFLVYHLAQIFPLGGVPS